MIKSISVKKAGRFELKRRWKKAMLKVTPTQFIVMGYFATILITSVLLWLPIAQRDGTRLTYLDSLFTATSSVTVTGLTVVSTADNFNLFGHTVLLIAFQIGGIGIMALGTLVWLLLGKNVGLSQRKLIMVDQNNSSLSGLAHLMKMLVLLAIMIETIGAIIFSIYFFVTDKVETLGQAIYYGVFHTISSYTNAGFDIFGDSLTSYAQDYFVQTVTMLLIVLGAIGFPVLVEVYEYVFGKNKSFRFSLFTKVTSSIFFILLIAGAVGVWLIENNLYFAQMPWHEKWFHSLFHSVTSRSAGLAIMDVNELSTSSQFLMSIFMFIGASPSSVGGGIRTTTFALIILSLITYARGGTEVRIFRRAIKEQDITKSFIVFTTATMICVTSIIFMSQTESHTSLLAIVFEVMSAFGTCGLSTGITPELTAEGKSFLMLIMFIGRIGMVQLLFIFQSRRSKRELYRYPKEDIMIG